MDKYEKFKRKVVIVASVLGIGFVLLLVLGVITFFSSVYTVKKRQKDAKQRATIQTTLPFGARQDVPGGLYAAGQRG